jgi:hypothetical protein
MKIGVCARIKDEITLNDWINYYLYLGFDRIIIYDNMSNPSVIFDNDKVKIIIDTFDGSNQCILYNNCLENNTDLDWILLCDGDEFLFSRKNIKKWLETFSDDTCSVLINWVVFGTSGKASYDHSKTVFDQFTKRESYDNFWNRFVKSFVRPKMVLGKAHVHITYNNNFKVKNVYNEEIEINDKCEHFDKKLSDTTPVVMFHYMTLDFENMLKKHFRNKKCGNGMNDKSDKYTIPWYKQYFKDNVNDFRLCGTKFN